MTKRPIVVFTPSADLYGSDRALLSALPVMQERGPVILLSAQPGPALDMAAQMGAEVDVLDDFAIRRRHLRPDRLPILARNVRRAARSTRERLAGVRPQLVFVNTLAVPLAGITRRLLDAPVIVHAHERYEGPIHMAKILGWPVRSADLVIANSNATADFIQAATHRHLRIEVAYNGIPLPESSPTFGPGGAPLRIGCVGRIHPKKGQPVLFDAIARAGRNWELHLFGDALPEHAEIEADLRARAVSGELGGPVEFHGFVTDTDACYDGIDISVVPSVRPEEFSLVAAEGQARGCATVVTGPGGAAEVVLDEVTGMVVPAGDADALAKALIRLDDDRTLLETMARAGEARVHEHFSEDAYRDRIRVLLDDVLSAP